MAEREGIERSQSGTNKDLHEGLGGNPKLNSNSVLQSSSSTPDKLPYAPYDPQTDNGELEEEVLPNREIPFTPMPNETVPLVPSKIPEIGQN